MWFKASWLRVVCVWVVVGWAGWAASAAAQTKLKYSLSGTGGFWIGAGLPVPITKGLPPNQAMVVIPNATLYQTLTATGGYTSPRQMTLCPWKLEGGAGLRGGKVRTWAPQASNNPRLFQVSSLLSMKFPASAAQGKRHPHQDGYVVFKKSGRTGASTYTWTGTPSVPGKMTYRRTAHQFGGPGQAQVAGKATPWGVAATGPPCKHVALGGNDPYCLAGKGYISPEPNAPLFHVGAPFGYWNTTFPQSAVPNLWVVWAASGGTLLFKAPAAQVPVSKGAKAFGGPWTTGKITITIIQPPATFTISGYDNRTPMGKGNISLVAGGLSNRAMAGPSADRGWLNLKVLTVAPRVPSLSSWGIASLGLLLLAAGAAGLELARRRR